MTTSQGEIRLSMLPGIQSFFINHLIDAGVNQAVITGHQICPLLIRDAEILIEGYDHLVALARLGLVPVYSPTVVRQFEGELPEIISPVGVLIKWWLLWHSIIDAVNLEVSRGKAA